MGHGVAREPRAGARRRDTLTFFSSEARAAGRVSQLARRATPWERYGETLWNKERSLHTTFLGGTLYVQFHRQTHSS